MWIGVLARWRGGPDPFDASRFRTEGMADFAGEHGGYIVTMCGARLFSENSAVRGRRSVTLPLLACERR
jgi:hypothetical protein